MNDNLFSSLLFTKTGTLQSWEASVQILSSPTASERSTVDKWTQSFSVEECTYATNGHATNRSTNNHKSDAADGVYSKRIVAVHSRFWKQIYHLGSKRIHHRRTCKQSLQSILWSRTTSADDIRSRSVCRLTGISFTTNDPMCFTSRSHATTETSSTGSDGGKLI